MEKFLYKNNISRNTNFNLWMAFPEIYSFAMSSLGYLWLFKLLDEDENINVERVCTDTQKTAIRYEDVDAIGFSFSFDTDFINIFKLMEKHGIPFKSTERNEDYPLIFVGGPVITANPAPYTEFFDFMIIGDGEYSNIEAMRICAQNKGKSKSEILKLISEIDGIYVPSYSIKTSRGVCKIAQCIHTPILSEEAFFKNTFIIETSRGCVNRCGFCIASYLNSPVRFAPYENIIEALDLGLQHTDKIALLGAQVSVHPQFKEICEYIYQKIQNGHKIEMGISSLRVDAVDPLIIKTLVAAGQNHVTIAIEAGSERLRKVINKNISELQIFNTLNVCKENGLKGLKIYCMLGLPTESQTDLEEMISLAKRMKQSAKGFDLTFSFSSFVPKPNTPLQWCGRPTIKELEEKQNYLKKEFHKLGIKARFSSAKWDYWQAVLSRGDISFSDFLIDVYKEGGKLGAFKKAAKGKFNPDDYAQRTYAQDEQLPWDFLEMKPDKDYLNKEYYRLLN